ncbi:MAG: hypothetical protein NUV46_03360 [Nanoarchaeota archaeon]|nr:hypothetical protein [Nanoarchaeota archaeon]
MIDLKKLAQKKGVKSAVFWPNWYSVGTIKDFLDNRSFIEPTKNMLPMGLIFYNSAVVQIENSVIFEKIDSKKGKFLDLSAEFEFPLNIHFLSIGDLDPPEDKDRLYKLVIKYSPKKEMVKVLNYEKSHPQRPQEIYENEFNKNLKFGFRFFSSPSKVL